MPKTKYLWNPLTDNVLEERDENGDLLMQYTHEPTLFGELVSQHSPTEGSQFYHFDGLGSTRRLSNEHEFLSDQLAYSAFGELLTPSAHLPPFLFVGELGYYFDEELGSTYVRVRSYAATTGRDTVPIFL